MLINPLAKHTYYPLGKLIILIAYLPKQGSSGRWGETWKWKLGIHGGDQCIRICLISVSIYLSWKKK